MLPSVSDTKPPSPSLIQFMRCHIQLHSLIRGERQVCQDREKGIPVLAFAASPEIFWHEVSHLLV